MQAVSNQTAPDYERKATNAQVVYPLIHSTPVHGAFEVEDMADYTIQIVVVTFTPDVDPQDMQSELNHPDVKKHLGQVLGRVLVLPKVPNKYRKAHTFSVVSVTVERKTG
jgi:hypothetical protein